jgi:hypothetical protein
VPNENFAGLERKCSELFGEIFHMDNIVNWINWRPYLISGYFQNVKKVFRKYLNYHWKAIIINNL